MLGWTPRLFPPAPKEHRSQLWGPLPWLQVLGSYSWVECAEEESPGNFQEGMEHGCHGDSTWGKSGITSWCAYPAVVLEPGPDPPRQKPLTCGGGSGIVQNTTVLILKSEFLRLQKELASLTQQNEQLMQQKSELLR